MPRRSLLIASLALIPALCSCGSGEAGAQPTLPPLTPEPGLSLPPAADPSPSGRPADLAPRVALARFLRGVGRGDARVCALLTPAYERTAFGGAGRCRTWIRTVRTKLPAEDLAALRSVYVPTGASGPGADDFTIEFADLQWRGDPAQPGEVLAARWVLHRTGRRWLISG